MTVNLDKSAIRTRYQTLAINMPETAKKNLLAKLNDNSDEVDNEMLAAIRLFESKLMRQYQPLVVKLAYQQKKKLPSNIEVDDLISAGNMGLLDAIRHFNQEKGTIGSYAALRINGAILDYLRQNDHYSRNGRDLAKKIQRTEKELTEKNGVKPSDVQMAAALELTLDDYQKKVCQTQTVTFQSQSPFPEEDSAPEQLMVTEDFSREELLYSENLWQSIITHLFTLKEKNILVFNLMHNSRLSIKMVANLFGISESRISQMNAGNIRKLSEQIINDPKLQKEVS